MAQPTPGPWRAVVPPSACLTDRFIVSESDETVAEVGGKYSMLDGDIFTVVANAKLIAAAPEMLDALKRMYPVLLGNAYLEAAEDIRKLINKAEDRA